MKISFDYDHTLSNPKYRALAKKFVAMGAEVHITTQREIDRQGRKLPYDNRQVFEVAYEIGIEKGNITFTDTKDKYNFVKEFDLHFDDDEEQIFLINDHPCKCIGVLIE